MRPENLDKLEFQYYENPEKILVESSVFFRKTAFADLLSLQLNRNVLKNYLIHWVSSLIFKLLFQFEPEYWFRSSGQKRRTFKSKPLE